MSYWRQFEQGMLSREAVRKLQDCTDVAADKKGKVSQMSEYTAPLSVGIKILLCLWSNFDIIIMHHNHYILLFLCPQSEWSAAHFSYIYMVKFVMSDLDDSISLKSSNR